MNSLDAEPGKPETSGLARRLGTSVVLTLLMAMVAFGVVIGLVFPPIVSPFVEWRPGMKLWFSLLCIVAGVLMGGISFFLVKVMLLRKIELVGDQLQVLSEGDGLTRRIRFTSNDELGKLIVHFNSLLDKLQLSGERIREVSDEISAHSARTLKASNLLTEGGEKKTQLVVDTAISIDGLEEGFQKIVEDLEQLQGSSDESRRAVQEQVALIEKVNNQINLLLQHCESNTQAIDSASAAGNKTLRYSQELSNALMDASASMTEMHHTIREVDGSLKQTAAISEQVSRDASVGKDSTWRTHEGMTHIREAFAASAGALESFAEKVKEISAITEVIDEVTDQTNLLALNAAIIAAQAGEHGRGFAVVADQIKKLAEQTFSSTREIGNLIKDFQEQAFHAIDTTSEIQGIIDEGVTLSQQSGEALDRILESASKTHNQVQILEMTMQEMSTTSNYLTEKIDTITGQSKEVAEAHREQESSLNVVKETVTETRDVAGVLSESSREQLASSRKIRQQSENVSSLVRNSADSVKAGKNETEELLTSIQEMQQLSSQEKETMAAFDEESQNLKDLYHKLREEVRHLAPDEVADEEK